MNYAKLQLRQQDITVQITDFRSVPRLRGINDLLCPFRLLTGVLWFFDDLTVVVVEAHFLGREAFF